MKKYILSILVMAGALFAAVACEKEASKPEEETTTPVSSYSFSWTTGSTSFSADNSFFVPAFNNIYAAKVNGAYVDITLDDLTKGNHTINPSAGITFEYSDGTTTFNGKSGTVTISENTGTTLSGSYSCTLENGSSISGSFSKIPQK